MAGQPTPPNVPPSEILGLIAGLLKGNQWLAMNLYLVALGRPAMVASPLVADHSSRRSLSVLKSPGFPRIPGLKQHN